MHKDNLLTPDVIRDLLSFTKQFEFANKFQKRILKISNSEDQAQDSETEDEVNVKNESSDDDSDDEEYNKKIKLDSDNESSE